MSALHEESAVTLVTMLKNGELSRREVAAHFLERIDRANPVLRAFVHVDAEGALARASEMDAHPQSANASVLAGLPIGDKDLIDRAGIPTSYGSRAMLGFVPTASNPLVTALDNNGANSLGKTNTPEFGFPSYTENLLPGGVARNPWTDRPVTESGPEDTFIYGPGGSSGGAAVAVAAGMLPVAPGSDGGGSVRIPAAACGLVGLKPARGRIPDAPGYELPGSLVVAGPLARSVADAALLLDAMIARTGVGVPDYRFASRPAAAGAEPTSYTELLRSGGQTRRLRIAVNAWSPWSEAYEIACDPVATDTLNETALLAERLGHDVELFTPAMFSGYVDAFRAVWRGGAASLPLTDQQLADVEPLTEWLVRSGRELPVADLARGLARLSEFERFIIAEYAPYDIVLTPALAMTPRPLGWYDQHDGEHNFVQQCQYTPYTSYVNAAGLPAITMPIAVDPLPVGVQAIGRPGDEATLLMFAQQLEAELHWDKREAPGWQLGAAG